VKAVDRKLVGRDIVAEVTGLGALGDQISDDLGQLLLRP